MVAPGYRRRLNNTVDGGRAGQLTLVDVAPGIQQSLVETGRVLSAGRQTLVCQLTVAQLVNKYPPMASKCSSDHNSRQVDLILGHINSMNTLKSYLSKIFLILSFHLRLNLVTCDFALLFADRKFVLFFFPVFNTIHRFYITFMLTDGQTV